MELSAAGMATYGNSFEEVIGLVTAGTEIMVGRSAQVARGLNTISANIVEQSETLADYGITVVQANGELTSTYDVLKQLKPVWDELTDAERQSLGQALAGKNQYRVLAAVMQNFEHAVEATETAINSAGSAMRENSAYMESLESKSTLLKASFQTLANDVIPKELIAKGLEALDGVLKILDTDLGVILTRITMLTGIGWGFSSLINASKILPTIISQFSNFTKLMTGATIVIPQAAAATGGLTAAMATFQSVALPIIAILTALGVGIYTLWERAKDTVSPIDKLTGSLQELNNSIENTNTNFEKSVGEIEATSAVAEQYIQRLEELEKQSSLTTEEQIEYNSILQNLESLIPSVSGLIDKQTGSIIGGTNALKEQIQAWKDLAIQQAYQERLTEVYKNYANAQIEYEQRKTELEGIQSQKSEAEFLLTQAVSKRNQLLTALETTTNKAEREYIGSQIGYYEGIIKEQQKLYESLGAEKVPYVQALDQFEAGLQSAQEEINKTEDAITKLMGSLSYSQPEVIVEKEEEIVNNYTGGATGSGGDSKVPEVLEEVEEKLIDIKEIIDSYLDSSNIHIDLLESEYQLLSLQDASEEDLIAKIKQIQTIRHEEAETLRKVLQNADLLKLNADDVKKIQTQINERSIDWWNWQNKINTLLEKAKESTEGIKEDVEDIYDKYMKAVEAERQEEREKRLKERKEWDTYKYWLEQAYKINSYVEQLKASNEELKKQLELQEKLDKLARAKESRVLVYRNGNYEYIQDVDQVSKAAKDLSTYQEEESLEKKINGLLELASAYQTMAEELASGKLGHSAIVAETIKAVEEQGGWRKVFGAYPEETPKTVEEIEINTREIANNLALIGKKIKVFPYAGGTTSASGGLSLVGEKGAELRVLNRGDGILPADLTSNLMRWGQFSPNEFKSNSITGFGSNMSVTIQALNLPNVSDGAGFVEYVRTHMFGQVLNLVH